MGTDGFMVGLATEIFTNKILEGFLHIFTHSQEQNMSDS